MPIKSKPSRPGGETPRLRPIFDVTVGVFCTLTRLGTYNKILTQVNWGQPRT